MLSRVVRHGVNNACAAIPTVRASLLRPAGPAAISGRGAMGQSSPCSPFLQRTMRENALHLEELWRKRIQENRKSLTLTSFDSPRSIDALARLIRKEGIAVENIDFARAALPERSINSLLYAIGTAKQNLPAFGVSNPNAAFNPVHIFTQPDLAKLIEMRNLMQNPSSKTWGYQMQNIPLTKEHVEALSKEVTHLSSKNVVVLTLSDKASTYYKDV